MAITLTRSTDDAALCGRAFSTMAPLLVTPNKASIRDSMSAFTTISSVFASHPRHSEFWWKTTGQVLSRLLEKAAYPPHLRRAYITFYYLLVIPEYGPDPFSRMGLFLFQRSHISLNSALHDHLPVASDADYITPANMASAILAVSPAALQDTHYVSYMTDDHSPVEFSCVFDPSGTPIVRFSIDPVARQEAGREPAIKLFEDYGSSFKLSDADLAWCRVCAEELTMVAPDVMGLEATRRPRYPSQYFAAFELLGSTPSMKAYFLPETVAAVTGISKLDLITRTVQRLAVDVPGLTTSWTLTRAFFDALPGHLTPSLEIAAVDCVPSHKNRLKIYVRTPVVTLENIKRFMTLDGTLRTPMIDKALQQTSILWRLIFGCIPDDAEPNVCEDRLRHLTGGLLFYYELRGDSPHPHPKVYLPVRHLCKDDAQVLHAMIGLYQAIGNVEAAKRYDSIVRDTFTHRALSSRTGLHTYITIAAKAKDVEITAYFNPECFRRGDTDH